MGIWTLSNGKLDQSDIYAQLPGIAPSCPPPIGIREKIISWEIHRVELPIDSEVLTALNAMPTMTTDAPLLAPEFEKQSPKDVPKALLRYILLTALAGGMAGTSGKTLIAPLDRIKILFQTLNPEFRQFSMLYFGLVRAARHIAQLDGFLGFFQGHSVTLLRIFPYAAVKFVVYEQIRNTLIPSEAYETNLRRLLAGSISGVVSVFCTYPLDLLRVRMAFDTDSRHRHGRSLINGRLVGTAKAIWAEKPRFLSVFLSKSLLGLTNFYRGFSPTILGMIPYAGVSFWTHDFVHDVFRSRFLARFSVDSEASNSNRPPLKAWAQLIAGGLAGLVSQTALYPFEVIRRRLQVGAVTNNGEYLSMTQMARIIFAERGLRGFYVGLSIGYIKVIPMVSCSFFVYERMKFLLGI